MTQAIAALDGATIPGGCDHCDAYQTAHVIEHGFCVVRVHHDDWCPWLSARLPTDALTPGPSPTHSARRGRLHREEKP